MQRAWIGILCCLEFSSIGCSDEQGSESAACSEICSDVQDECKLDSADTRLCEQQCETRYASSPAECGMHAAAAVDCSLRAEDCTCPGFEPLFCVDEIESYRRCVEENIPKLAYCEKCDVCYESGSEFGAAFCAPFWDGSSFVLTSCVEQGDATMIRDKLLSVQAIESMSCGVFADRI